MHDDHTKTCAALPYKILYHRDGYIRLEVPSLRRLAWTHFFATFRNTLPFALPSAIKDFHLNPLTGNIVITYEPTGFDILDYLQKMAADPEIVRIMKGRPR